ncbi:hypothetical protein HETIRDRAFT_319714 [Heterobasidion irregulare TC 32-1]|uniref:Uncharacterized protein n=1 Tax=Heterobasidion irregulare (strain TC 32-1) TaxID=747525 RepID=W4K3Y9_HETIT|nr:uncharacterized protein HETIRDRAFT_319714 [Heterobasidion irregulare TC 32-1]ETW80527.1 hypothetical protein HETIRDRAFT_319714 [Heterobasidion irregulare TC 32-1]
MAFQCLACPRNFHDRRALKTHQWNCKGYQEIQDVTFQQKRARKEETVEEAETLSRKRAQVLVEPKELTAESSRFFAYQHNILDSVPIPESSSSELPPSPEPPITRSARSGRGIRFPKRFDNFLPSSATPLSHIPSKQHPLPTQPNPVMSMHPR